MIQGTLWYNSSNRRFGILGADDFWCYDGLHCGTCLEVFVLGAWLPARIEFGWSKEEWYLVGEEEKDLDLSLPGLRVRIA